MMRHKAHNREAETLEQKQMEIPCEYLNGTLREGPGSDFKPCKKPKPLEAGQTSNLSQKHLLLKSMAE